jgi:hypothetical protein
VKTYTKQELNDILRDKFYVYKTVHPKTLYHPEEGVYQCPICHDEYPDHDHGCANEIDFDAIDNFISLLKEAK